MTTDTQNQAEWLASLKVGDRVRHRGVSILAIRSYNREETITAATKRHVSIGGFKFRRGDGSWVGNRDHGWGRHISMPTAVNA